MSNQSFDSNGPSSTSGPTHDADPIPIARQLRQQDYLSNIQHKLEELVEASEVETPDAEFTSAMRSSSPTPSSEPSAPVRVNKMDSFFEKMAAEEEAAASALATKLNSETEAEIPQSNIDHEAQHLHSDTQHEAENTLADSSEVSPAAPTEIPRADSRPTGYAGLSAGLAAAGLGNLGARLAEESNAMTNDDAVIEQSNSSAEPASLSITPTIPVMDLQPSEPRFDLEAARLEEVTGPVFSQEFDEKEITPEERLFNRLQREKLLAPENSLADQLPSTPLSSPHQSPALDQQLALDQPPTLDQQAADVSPKLPTALDLQGSEPVADLFVEVPQVSQPADQFGIDRHESQVQPVELLEDEAPRSITQPLEESASRPATVPEVNSLEAEPQAVIPQPPAPQLQAPEESVDPRLLEAKRLEEEFKQLQKQEASYLEQAQSEQVKHEQSAKRNLDSDQREVPENAPLENAPLKTEQQANDERYAAILQAERVKEARERASQIVESVESNNSPTSEASDWPDLSPQDIETTARPSTFTNDSQFADQPALTHPVPLHPESPNSGPVPQAGEKQEAKQLAAGHQFQIELFFACMLEHLSDGVVFVDHKQRVKMWSRGAQKATGIIPKVVLDRPLLPQTINLCDTAGNGLQLDKCPVAKSLRTLEIVSGEYKISNGTGPEGMKVELTVIPVIDKNRYVNGAVVMFHDRTAHVNLQRQLKDLYEFSVLDPLTQVANRAEFERVQQEYVLAFQQSDDFNCSIIICDIDFFKSINDNFGHTVGDEALMSFAAMLKRYVRPQDLVARYGGEEFVILCADCDTAAAVQRAEEIRMALYKTPQPMLGGKSISASFGVSELREGDTATDFFVRADTALLQAKESGRNRVVAGDGSLPTGNDEKATELSETGILWSAQQRKSKSLICEEFKTETPIQVLVEKLRGFIIENNAVLQRVEPEFLSMEVEVEAPMDYSKKGAFTMNVEFKEADGPNAESARTKTLNYIRVTIYAGRMRSWFSTNHTDLAPHLLGELRRFLMISDKASRISVDMATKKVR